jgi:hypothetical protein
VHRATVTLAVPASVVELLAHQVLDELVAGEVVDLEPGEQPVTRPVMHVSLRRCVAERLMPPPRQGPSSRNSTHEWRARSSPPGSPSWRSCTSE